MKSMPSRECGATLIVALVMLVLITLFAITSFNLGKGNLQMVGNMQLRNQALSAAQEAIERVISIDFTATPANAVSTCVPAVANTACVDVNGDGVADVTVAIAPRCVAIKVIPVGSLSFTDSNDVGCLVGINPEFGVAGGASNASLCADALWDLQATATDPIRNAKYIINQGTNVRKPATWVCPAGF